MSKESGNLKGAKTPRNQARNRRIRRLVSAEFWARVLALLAGAFPIRPMQGQIFVENWENHSIGEYAMSGAAVNASLIWLWPPGSLGAVGLALDGSGHLFVADGPGDAVREYMTSGVVVNSSLVSGLSWPEGLALDGQGHFFVANAGVTGTPGTIGEYSISGAVINASLVSGLSSPFGLALDGDGYLYVANSGNGTIGEYTTSGTVVNAALVTGLQSPRGLVCDGNGHLFVANWDTGTIGEYTTSGAVVNASLISGLNYPGALALDGNGHLFVGNWGSGTVGEYTLSGAVVNASLITVADKLDGLAVVALAPPVIAALQCSVPSDQVILSWPASASNFVLETSSTLSSEASWTPLTNGVATSAGSFVLTNPMAAPSAFYRLRGQ
jgi:hypothetical protein